MFFLGSGIDFFDPRLGVSFDDWNLFIGELRETLIYFEAAPILVEVVDQIGSGDLSFFDFCSVDVYL